MSFVQLLKRSGNGEANAPINWIPSCCKRVKNGVALFFNPPCVVVPKEKKVYILRKRGILEAIAELKASIIKEKEALNKI